MSPFWFVVALRENAVSFLPVTVPILSSFLLRLVWSNSRFPLMVQIDAREGLRWLLVPSPPILIYYNGLVFKQDTAPV